MKEVIKKEITEHVETILLLENISNEIKLAAEMAIDCLKNNNKILLFGNGGSAADAQHIAAELVGRYKSNRKGLAAIALTTDTSALTAIGNDFSYNEVFSRQVEALANKGDLIIGISTSGNSSNVINAINLGKKLGVKSVGFSGCNGGEMKNLCDLNIIVPSNNTPRVQEAHILIGHIICQLIDNSLS